MQETFIVCWPFDFYGKKKHREIRMEKTTNLRLILTSCSQLRETMMGSTVYLIFVLRLSITRA